jgi:branched-chain amino acid transport system ATP-binding protein
LAPSDVIEQPFLEVRDLSVVFGHIEALRGVSLDVRRGELVALIGANGAGKTTLLETVLGIHAPSHGSISFKGRHIEGARTDRSVRLGISLVPEGRGVFNSMSVRDNLLLGAYHQGKNARTRLERIYAWFPFLRTRGGQTATTLSGGERRMLAFGRALMASPDLLLVDEPSLGLAPLAVSEVFSILAKLKTEGHTILLAEQNAAKALEFADRGYVLEIGRVALSGAAGELRANEEVRAAYLGVP